MAIRAVVFDVGNVLYDWHPRYLYEKLIDDPVELDRIVSVVMSNEWHWALDHGRVWADIEPDLIAKFPDDADYIRAWGSRFGESIGDPIPGMHEIVRELDAADVPIFGITNFPGEFWTPFRAKEAEIFDRFANIVVSGEEGIAKPDPAIFQLALKRFGLGPGEGLFLDDLASNAEASEREGFAGHHFRDAETAYADLVRRGLLG
ncbi:MAG: HAD family phosphatase [Sphingomonadaceae bacterium]|nr:HAD family phosphatase [Sphingomonadaceae bacterium]